MSRTEEPAGTVTGRTAMVLLGEDGGQPAPPDHPAAAGTVAATGALFAVDEVQTGTGRTEHWSAHQAQGVAPDVLRPAPSLVLTEARVDASSAAPLDTATGTSGARTGSNRRPSRVHGPAANPGSVQSDNRR